MMTDLSRVMIVDGQLVPSAVSFVPAERGYLLIQFHDMDGKPFACAPIGAEDAIACRLQWDSAARRRLG